MEIKAVIEGLLFIAGDEGMSLDDMIEVLGISEYEVKKTLLELCDVYDLDISRGIRIEVLGNHFKFVTKKEHKDYYQKLNQVEKKNHFSQAALETLAIIAYNQPITKNDIEQIRGVDCRHHLRNLMIRELIVEVGKSDLAGKPSLYGTTDRFLDYFGLASIHELPELNIEELPMEEKNLFDSKYREDNGKL